MIRTGVADVEAFPSIRVVGLELQPYDVSIRGDLGRNIFARECSECCWL